MYQKFEEIIGDDIPLVQNDAKDVITVHTYELEEQPSLGMTRGLVLKRAIKFKLDEFSARFISGPNLPSGDILDNKIREILACK